MNIAEVAHVHRHPFFYFILFVSLGLVLLSNYVRECWTLKLILHLSNGKHNVKILVAGGLKRTYAGSGCERGAEFVHGLLFHGFPLVLFPFLGILTPLGLLRENLTK